MRPLVSNNDDVGCVYENALPEAGATRTPAAALSSAAALLSCFKDASCLDLQQSFLRTERMEEALGAKKQFVLEQVSKCAPSCVAAFCSGEEPSLRGLTGYKLTKLPLHQPILKSVSQTKNEN